MNSLLIEQDNVPKDGLTILSKCAYAVGHVLNDITSSMINIYQIFQLTIIVKMTPQQIGIIFLWGQVADAFITPVFGQVSDNIDTPLGKRMPIYIIGVLQVFVSIIGMFGGLGGCFVCSEDSPNIQFQLFIFHFVIYGFQNSGFAALQTGHLSVIPTTSADDEVKDSLVTQRTTFIFISGGVSMIISSGCIQLQSIEEALETSGWIQGLIGLACSLFFVFCFNEIQLTDKVNEQQKHINSIEKNEKNNVSPNRRKLSQSEESVIHMLDKDNSHQYSDFVHQNRDIILSSNIGRKVSQCTVSTQSIQNKESSMVKPLSWMKSSMFWINICTYASARIAQNQIPTVINIYLATGMNLHSKIHITLLPLLQMAFSCIGMYVSQMIIGFVTSIQLSVATCLISDLIGENGSSAAFVQSMQSFVDKMSNGVTVWVFQNFFDLNSDFQVSLNVVMWPIVFVISSQLSLLIKHSPPKFSKKDYQ